jgi:hypothetical protein
MQTTFASPNVADEALKKKQGPVNHNKDFFFLGMTLSGTS